MFYIIMFALLVVFLFNTVGQFLFKFECPLLPFDKKMEINDESIFMDEFGAGCTLVFIEWVVIAIPLIALRFAPIQTAVIGLVLLLPLTVYYVVRKDIKKKE